MEIEKKKNNESDQSYFKNVSEVKILLLSNVNWMLQALSKVNLVLEMHCFKKNFNEPNVCTYFINSFKRIR